MSCRILLAEDHTIVRQGLCALIEKQSDMKVIGEADKGTTAVKMTTELMPDIVIMDVAMPEMNGIEATKRIKEQHPEIKILALSVHDDRELVLNMVKAGVSGYLLKDCVYHELVGAIRAVGENKSYLSPRITKVLLEEHNHPGESEEKQVEPDVLKDIEIEILRLLAEGKTAREISAQVKLHIKTVEARRRRIMKKVNVSTFAGLIKYAIKSGLISD